VNYTWTDEETKYNTEHKVDPNINPYTGKPYQPKPPGYYQELEPRLDISDQRMAKFQTAVAQAEGIGELGEIGRAAQAEDRKLQCSKCGAVTQAACECQVDYKSVPGE
jgi:hypothetical protein